MRNERPGSRLPWRMPAHAEAPGLSRPIGAWLTRTSSVWVYKPESEGRAGRAGGKADAVVLVAIVVLESRS